MIARHKSYLSQSSVSARQEAEENGWKVVVAKDNQLFLDLDTAEDISRFLRMWESFQKLFPEAKITKQGSSKSGVGRHIYIQLSADVPPLLQIAMQAALGSDGRKEMCSIVRVLKQDPEPILFFESKRG